ncbi:hypothetical protein K438DRAFT_1765640 [Mycena galopus ATCC 62051]|nr:hypothetical protein K438DRAFT_1765640 [Mycena galopus ATCC 62051]
MAAGLYSSGSHHQSRGRSAGFTLFNTVNSVHFQLFSIVPALMSIGSTKFCLETPCWNVHLFVCINISLNCSQFPAYFLRPPAHVSPMNHGFTYCSFNVFCRGLSRFFVHYAIDGKHSKIRREAAKLPNYRVFKLISVNEDSDCSMDLTEWGMLPPKIFTWQTSEYRSKAEVRLAGVPDKCEKLCGGLVSDVGWDGPGPVAVVKREELNRGRRARREHVTVDSGSNGEAKTMENRDMRRQDDRARRKSPSDRSGVSLTGRRNSAFQRPWAQTSRLSTSGGVGDREGSETLFGDL